ncbi:aldehyde dehydrogenase family protein [Desulfotalea psychrophila]|uniref:Related to acetaldehyde dehydrogenase n=1 Tax=Desulfotalea psychrophila (strain LSv54 / DSM 12343) TaxID=177439 RepID=Q6AM74_DESPS|nr:aldehyde dehydrogenase family protein [Desulfotalea psychrophila]CAG36551.1 related to acetaldehyde dehydrogenase [Desulfotalea psychrophila LSv54]
MIVDNDLLSVQEARILVEDAFEAQKKLATFSQEKLDEIVEGMTRAVEGQLRDLAQMSQEETEIGKWQDKHIKNSFVCSYSRSHLRYMHCVGVIGEDPMNAITEIGVPIGVIVSTCPETSPVSTAIYNTLIAIKSGNAIIFSPHPRARQSIGKTLDIMREAAQAHGLPEGCLAYLQTVDHSGLLELMNHDCTSLLLIGGDEILLQTAAGTGKTIIYGGTGNGPAFIERSADIEQAARDIIASKSFDNGIAPAAEQSLVVDAPVAEDVRRAMKRNGAYFMSEQEASQLVQIFFTSAGKHKKGVVGISAQRLAQRAGFIVPADVTLLVAERKYVSEADPYYRAFLAPVLAMYVEEDWMDACEKCIELLLYEKKAHSLVIHSCNKEIIHQFALKKPVARLLVNTPGAFGGMGATTNLFPSMMLGSSSAGHGVTSDNVSPLNLIYRRKVGYQVRSMEEVKKTIMVEEPLRHVSSTPIESNDSVTVEVIHQILKKAIKTINDPAAH